MYSWPSWIQSEVVRIDGNAALIAALAWSREGRTARDGEKGLRVILVNASIYRVARLYCTVSISVTENKRTIVKFVGERI